MNVIVKTLPWNAIIWQGGERVTRDDDDDDGVMTQAFPARSLDHSILLI